MKIRRFEKIAFIPRDIDQARSREVPPILDAKCSKCAQFFNQSLKFIIYMLPPSPLKTSDYAPDIDRGPRGTHDYSAFDNYVK